jgi:hypothetical protein
VLSWFFISKWIILNIGLKYFVGETFFDLCKFRKVRTGEEMQLVIPAHKISLLQSGTFAITLFFSSTTICFRFFYFDLEFFSLLITNISLISSEDGLFSYVNVSSFLLAPFCAPQTVFRTVWETRKRAPDTKCTRFLILPYLETGL